MHLKTLPTKCYPCCSCLDVMIIWMPFLSCIIRRRGSDYSNCALNEIVRLCEEKTDIKPTGTISIRHWSDGDMFYQFFLLCRSVVLCNLDKYVCRTTQNHCAYRRREIELIYRQVSNIRRTLIGNRIVDRSDVVGASPVGAAPTKFSFST